MFGIFKKKAHIVGYSKFGRIGYDSRVSAFEDNNIELPLGINAYGTGYVLFEDNGISYNCDILTLANEVSQSGDIYEDSIVISSYIENKEGHPEVKYGYVRTRNVPYDIFKEWVEKTKQLEDKKEAQKLS